MNYLIEMLLIVLELTQPLNSFLNLAPEDEVIDASSLTKFRKLRMKNESIMDKLIVKSVEIALNNGIKLSKTLIVDSTHSEARYNAKSAREYLLEVCKNLRKKVYDIDESYTSKMPKNPKTVKQDYTTMQLNIAKMLFIQLIKMKH